MLLVGLSLTLAVSAGSASPSSTAGIAGASDEAVLARPVAVNNPTGLPSAVALATAGKAAFVQPPFHVQGAPTLSHFHLTGDYDADDAQRARHVADRVLSHLRDDAPLTARRVLESDGANVLNSDDLNALRIRVASGLLYDGANKAALVLAEASITPDDDDALWTAGLAAYRLHQSDKAVRYFTTAADMQTDPWGISAAAFWVARSLTQGGDSAGAQSWLVKAAAQKGTFYGLLAARALEDAKGAHPDTMDITNAGYAVPRWKPHNGFAIDPALMFAVMRQESKFDPEAESGAGAIGLMQIMPATAGHVTQRHADWQNELFDPEINMDIGQRYIAKLLQSQDIDNNLIRLAVAYNSGPSTLDHGRRLADEDDALMYLETIPAGETKGFAEQVLTNYWNYRMRLKEDTTSLSALAAGKWPLYSQPPVKPTLVLTRVSAFRLD